jgi:hypothetical protein
MSWRDWVVPRPTLDGNSSLKITLFTCLAGLTAVTYYLWSSGPFQFPYDDSFIILEFARSLAATGRMSYDGIHTTPGATTLLYVMLLSVPARLGLPLQLANVTMGVLFFILLIQRTGALAMYLTQSREASLYAALTTALTGYLVFDALNGMETTLFIFLTVACVGSLIKSCDRGNGYLRPALWLYLTALTRPEGYWLAVSLIFYVAVLAARRRQGILSLASLAGHLAGAVLVALLTQWLMLGAVTPHTALAKVYLYNQFRMSLHVRSIIYGNKMRLIWAPLILPLLPALWTRKARPLVVGVLPWILITQVMFWLLLPIEVGTYEGRYLHPLMPFLFILAGDGFSVLLHKTGKYRIPRWALAVFLAALTGIFYFNLVSMHFSYVDDKAGIRNNNIWSVEWLQANAPPGIRVATHDIGALRYLGRYELVDLSGLTDEEAMARNRDERGQLEYLFARRPDYLVGDAGWLKTFLHYFPAIRCCATEVATAHPNALTGIQLRIYRMHWDQLDKGIVNPEIPTPSQ